MDKIKKLSAATTILGPAGVSNSSDPESPSQTESTPIMMAINAICSGDFEKRLAAAAGIISKAVIKSTPTIFIETAITAAKSTVNTILAKSGLVPSAVANS